MIMIHPSKPHSHANIIPYDLETYESIFCIKLLIVILDSKLVHIPCYVLYPFRKSTNVWQNDTILEIYDDITSKILSFQRNFAE